MNGPQTAARKGRLDVDRTQEALVQLGFTHAAERLGELLSEAVKTNVPPHRFLDRLLEAEIRQREERRIKTSLRLSGPPPEPHEGLPGMRQSHRPS